MESEFVSYQQALELKELGFDEPCICGYNDYHLLRSKISSSFDGDFVKWDEKYDKDLKAPLYQQAFRWFREKHSIYFTPKQFDETKWIVEWRFCEFIGVFDIFEEAEVACLDKLIEIVKNK